MQLSGAEKPPGVEGNLSPVSEERSQPILKITVGSIKKPHLKVASQEGNKNSCDSEYGSGFRQKQREHNRISLPTSSAPCRTDSSANSLTHSPKVDFRVTSGSPATVIQHPIAVTKSLPCNLKGQYSDIRQWPSTSKAYEEFVNADAKATNEDDSVPACSARSPDSSKALSANSFKSIIAESKVSPKATRKMTPVLQRLKNRSSGISVNQVQVQQSSNTAQMEVDFDVKIRNDETSKNNIRHTAFTSASVPSPSSSLTINLPLYRPTEDKNKTQDTAKSIFAERNNALISTPGPEKQLSNGTSGKHILLHRISAQPERNNALGQDRNDGSRKERKKNRSILMDPLEVNWSVDELRQKFQAEGGPPSLNTEYSPTVLH